MYRFALLLTGDEGKAQQVLYEACVDCGARLGSYRSEVSRLACMLGNVRQKAKAAPASIAGMAGGTPAIVRGFATLPEEERAALAGLYSGLLGARELAEALKMPLEQLGRVLKSAREQLERAGIELDEPNVEKAL